MSDRQLIADLLSALEYHTEQTRPIEFSKVAIQAAREYLRKPAQQQEPVAAAKKDAVFAASIEFIGTLTGMQPPPIETAPPEIFKPFRDFTEKVCSIIAAPQPAQQQFDHTAAANAALRDAQNRSYQIARAAQQQEPAQRKPKIGETNVELGFYSNDASNGQQRELVSEVEMGQLVGNRPHESASNPDAKRAVAVITGVDEYGPMLGWRKHWINYPVGMKLYTSPPASKPWVGLTDDEIAVLDVRYHRDNWKLIKEAEAKLKEKNS